MKRAIRIDTPPGSETLGKELLISKLTVLRNVKSLLYFEEMANGTWRITHSGPLFLDFTQVERFVFEGLPDNPKKKRQFSNVKMRIEGTEHVWDLASVLFVNSKDGERFIRFEVIYGKWKLIMSQELVETLPKLTSFTMIRED